jgi:Amt family ammonium transporter
MSAAAAILNTNLCCAVAFMIWVAWDYITGRKPSLLGGVNGMITGLVAITPAAGYVNGWGAIAIAVIASTLVYFALNYLSRLRPFRNVDDTLGVIYTHGFAGLAGGLLTGIFADPNMAVYYTRTGKHYEAIGAKGLIHGNWTLLKWQALAAAFVIVWSAAATWILLKLVGLFVPLRMSEENMEIGDTAEHGHEVYPSDVPSLGYPGGMPGVAPGAGAPAPA